MPLPRYRAADCCGREPSGWRCCWLRRSPLLPRLTIPSTPANYAAARSAFELRPAQIPSLPAMLGLGTTGLLPPEIISDSRACGAPGCHAAIYDEWRASAHRWSEEDQFFQAVRTATTEVQGIKATEKCGGCHAPVSMLSGYKDPTLGHATSGYAEGDSCVVCHAVSQVDERGIGSYVLGMPKEYLYDHHPARLHLLPQSFFDSGLSAPTRPRLRFEDRPRCRSCAPCHKEYDKVGKYPDLLEVETQYDDWKQHKWNTDRDASSPPALPAVSHAS